MKIALVAAIAAAAVAAGSALAVGRPTGTPVARPAHPHAHAPAHKAPPATRGPVSEATVQSRIAVWSAAHPGWTNPADMTHAQMLQAAIDHPAVYAPNLVGKSRAQRIIDEYGAWATMSPQLRAIERAEGIAIPDGIPYVPLRAARRP